MSESKVDKCHIVDDDRYAPFYAHYFAKGEMVVVGFVVRFLTDVRSGKRKHGLFFGEMPETNDPVIFALEQIEGLNLSFRVLGC